ncbi:MAG: hypothetical protein ACR2HJ_12010 [Fimbriimonadales bacterium]
MFSARYVDIDADRARYRLTAAYRFTPRLQAGLEYNPAADEIGFIGNYILATETPESPAISLGTSSDRIGTPAGPKMYYVTFSKGLSSLKLVPYVSIAYSEHDDGINFPFGATYWITPQWSILGMNDGRKSHLMLNHLQHDFSVSLMLVRMERFGLSLAWGF